MKQRTEQKEDYLKEIFKNDGVRNFVTNKVLSTNLNVSAASVSEMINKLKKDGYVEYVSYKGVRLNEAGIKVTSKIIRNHRIFETFLYDKLGYSLSEVHGLSEQIEHIKDDEFFTRLYSFLGRPKRCPHGGIISTDILKSEDYIIPISQYPVATELAIKRFEDNYELLSYVEKVGLKINDTVTITDKSEQPQQLSINFSNKIYDLPSNFSAGIYGIPTGN
ncbi:MAG: metal-dependent transcriptional regulator [Streptococcaceae bacterium]|jgi:DtxR family Mn-dependent transcriptional regulator|nr:metal-dependent transcriptional regulator [Streptococcaceae bacterium]